MKLSDFSIEALNPFITGDESPAPRMSGSELIKFFNMFDVRDVYSFENGGLSTTYCLSRRRITINGQVPLCVHLDKNMHYGLANS